MPTPERKKAKKKKKLHEEKEKFNGECLLRQKEGEKKYLGKSKPWHAMIKTQNQIQAMRRKKPQKAPTFQPPG